MSLLNTEKEPGRFRSAVTNYPNALDELKNPGLGLIMSMRLISRFLNMRRESDRCVKRWFNFRFAAEVSISLC